MPNDCWNEITITCEDTNVFNTITTEVLAHKIDIIKYGSRGIIFRLCTAWTPEYAWLEHLLDKYPCWIKNEWYEEGGYAGIWIGFFLNGEKKIQKFTWEDLSLDAKAHYFT